MIKLLAGKLSQLVQQTLEVLEAKRSEAKPMIITLVKHKISDFRIDDKGSGWQAHDEPFEKIDWSTFLFELVQNEIRNQQVFKEITDIVVRDYQEIFRNLSPDVNKKSQAEFWLGNFVRHVLKEKLENTLTESRLIELITVFENELNCSPMENKITSYVGGVYLKTELILADENITIRNLKASDLEYEYYPFAPFLSPRLEMRHPSAVIEIMMRIKDQPEIWKKLERTLLIFRLFRLGSVYSLWNEHTHISVMWPSGTSSSWSGSGFTELHKYVIQETEIENFQKFFQRLMPLIKNVESIEGAMSLSIAIRRYNNALLDPLDNERRLMTAMMALESLYSIPSDKGETGYRISLRIAKLLSFLAFKPADVRRNIEKSYYVRNKVAHGLIVDKKKIDNVADLLNTLLEYLRISIIVFLFMEPSQKNRFVASIDNSLIDVTSSIEIKNQIATIAEQLPNFPISI